jgi:hypothetical protein
VTDPQEFASPGLAERYGSRRRVRPGVAVLAVLFVGALTAWAVWAGLASRPSIDATLTAYDVVSTHEVRVKITTHFRDDTTQGTCLVRATAEDHTIVGEVNLTAEQLREAQGAWIPVRTERRATTAEVVRCEE